MIPPPMTTARAVAGKVLSVIGISPLRGGALQAADCSGALCHPRDLTHHGHFRIRSPGSSDAAGTAPEVLPREGRAHQHRQLPGLWAGIAKRSRVANLGPLFPIEGYHPEVVPCTNESCGRAGTTALAIVFRGTIALALRAVFSRTVQSTIGGGGRARSEATSSLARDQRRSG
jgi:hypothetical protein